MFGLALLGSRSDGDVCGCNGLAYSDTCSAHRYSVAVAYAGSCLVKP